jgi:hypothetical protein
MGSVTLEWRQRELRPRRTSRGRGSKEQVVFGCSGTMSFETTLLLILQAQHVSSRLRCGLLSKEEACALGADVQQGGSERER